MYYIKQFLIVVYSAYHAFFDLCITLGMTVIRRTDISHAKSRLRLSVPQDGRQPGERVICANRNGEYAEGYTDTKRAKLSACTGEKRGNTASIDLEVIKTEIDGGYSPMQCDSETSRLTDEMVWEDMFRPEPC